MLRFRSLIQERALALKHLVSQTAKRRICFLCRRRNVRNNPSVFVTPNSRRMGGSEVLNSRTKKELFLHTRRPGV
jgi:hypothetical protein